VKNFLEFANFIDTLSKTSVIWQNLLMNSKEKKTGNEKKSTERYLKN